jgi:hypothetical protein
MAWTFQVCGWLFGWICGRQQIGSPPPGVQVALFLPPAGDLLVVPRQEDVRHGNAAVLSRPRVLRKLEQAAGRRERVALAAFFVP